MLQHEHSELYENWNANSVQQPGWSQVSFSEFWVELLNANDWAVYQIEANKKLYLV